MKVFIWVLFAFVTSLVINLLKLFGFQPGGLIYALLCAPMFFGAPYLCRKWDKHKEKENSEHTDGKDSLGNDESTESRKMMLMCAVCGAENPEDSRFCEVCGKSLRRSSKLINKQRNEAGRKEKNNSGKHGASDTQNSKFNVAKIQNREKNIDKNDVLWRDEWGKISCKKENCSIVCGASCPIYAYEAAMECCESDVVQAITFLKEAVSIAPDYFDAWDKMGALYDSIGQKECAYNSLKKAVSIEKSKPKTVYNLIKVTYDEDRYEECLSWCENYRILSLDQREQTYIKLCQEKLGLDATEYGRLLGSGS